MKWTIDKSFDWCYGHRVWSQELNADFTSEGDTCLACRHLHGHQGKLKVFLESDELDHGMVTDFKHLGWMKDFIDDVLDHKFIMDINDPLLPHEVPDFVNSKGGYSNLQKHDEGYMTPRLDNMKHLSQAVIEKYEGMLFVDFIPTSENLSAWLLNIAAKKMAEFQPEVRVVAVEFWETPKSHCKVEV